MKRIVNSYHFAWNKHQNLHIGDNSAVMQLVKTCVLFIDHIQQWKCKKYEIRFTGKTTLFRTSSKNCLKHNLSRKFSVHQNSMPLKFSQVLRGPILFALQYKKKKFYMNSSLTDFIFKLSPNECTKSNIISITKLWSNLSKQNVRFTSFFRQSSPPKINQFFVVSELAFLALAIFMRKSPSKKKQFQHLYAPHHRGISVVSDGFFIQYFFFYDLFCWK